MKVLQVPILLCFRCKRNFTPKIDTDALTVAIPKACPHRDCRSQTWNVPGDELKIIRKTQNLNLLNGPKHKTGIKKSVPVLAGYLPKKNEKVPLVVCVDCELFFCDGPSLKRHQHRRHHGMCSKCHASNVYVALRNGNTVCQNCVEPEK